MTSRSPAAGTTALVLSAFLLAGCGAGDATSEGPLPADEQSGNGEESRQSGQEASPEEAEPTQRAEAIWEIEADLVGYPTLAEGVVTAYVRNAEDGFDAVAWDWQTQEELWRRTAAAGAEALINTPSLHESVGEYTEGHYVTFLQDAANTQHNLFIVDLHTGEELVEKLVWGGTRPRVCGHSENVCYNGWSQVYQETTDAYSVEVDPSTAEFSTVSEGTEGKHMEGGYVPLNRGFFTDHGDPGRNSALAYAPQGEILWERSYHEVFGDDFTPDQGWDFQELSTASDLILGWAFRNPTQELNAAQVAIEQGEEPEPVTTVTSEATHYVALDKTSGETVWEMRGLSHCPHLPQHNDQLMTQCRWTAGEYTWNSEEDRSILDTDDPVEEESVELLGLDPATGEVLWDVPVDVESFGTLLISSDRSILQHSDRILVSIDGEQVVVDTETGETEDLPEDELFLCQELRDPVEILAGEDIRRIGAGHDHILCDADRNSVEYASLPAHLLDLPKGESDDEDVALISIGSRLVGYDTSDIDREGT